MVAVRAAAETLETVRVDVATRVRVVVEGTANLAVPADGVGGRDDASKVAARLECGNVHSHLLLSWGDRNGCR